MAKLYNEGGNKMPGVFKLNHCPIHEHDLVERDESVPEYTLRPFFNNISFYLSFKADWEAFMAEWESARSI